MSRVSAPFDSTRSILRTSNGAAVGHTRPLAPDPSMTYILCDYGWPINNNVERDCVPKSVIPVLLTVLLTLSSCSNENSSVSTQSTLTVVQIRLVEDNPLVEVKINGTPVDVQFDIGNGTTLALFPTHLGPITKRRVGTSTSGMSMSGPTGERPVYDVDVITIGDLAFKNARIVEDYHDDEYREWFTSRLDANGFLGRGLFDQFKVVVDVPNRELTFIPPDAPFEQQSVCKGAELPLVQGQDWGLVSKATTEIGELILVWDTGTPATGVLKRRTDIDNLGYADGDTLSVEKFNIDGHELGPQTFEVWDWSENAPPFDGFIGFDFFAEHVVCIDFPKNRIFVQL